MMPINFGCADSNGRAASIYVMETSEDKSAVFKGVELECFNLKKKAQPCISYFGVFKWSEQSNEAMDTPLFYFRDETIIAAKMAYIEHSIRPFYSDKQLEYFMCENRNSKDKVSSHICFVITRKTIKLFRDNTTAFLLYDPIIRRCEFNVYRLCFSQKYLVINNERCHGHMKYADSVLTLQ